PRYQPPTGPDPPELRHQAPAAPPRSSGRSPPTASDSAAELSGPVKPTALASTATAQSPNLVDQRDAQGRQGNQQAAHAAATSAQAAAERRLRHRPPAVKRDRDRADSRPGPQGSLDPPTAAGPTSATPTPPPSRGPVVATQPRSTDADGWPHHREPATA